ncbi:MAG: SdrD B-like domain-containing protein, partial [Saprospiraceae bacterium]
MKSICTNWKLWLLSSLISLANPAFSENPLTANPWATSPSIAPPPCTGAATEIGGTVFQDFNGDGSKNGAEPGISGVSVSAFDANDAPASPTSTAISTADGTYLLTGLAAGTNYRLEFTWSDATLQPGAAGGTSVQIATSGDCSVNFGLSNPYQYCQDNPKMVTSCYAEGSNVGSGTDVLISMGFNTPVPPVNHESVGSQIGSTYGLAYQRSSSSMFAGAFMKRFAGFGPGGPGAIYRITNPSDGLTSGSVFVDLNTLFGSPVAGTDPHDFTLYGGEYEDNASFDAAGRRAFGDLDISDDELTLYAVNLNDRSLYVIPLGTDPSNPVAPTLSSQVTVVPLADAGSPLPDLPSGINNSEIIPFALKYHDGLLYIGFVANGQSGGTRKAFAYSYNPVGGAFVKVLEFDLTYARGCAFADGPTCYGAAAWNNWVSAYPASPAMFAPYSTPEVGHPQPIFADIEFDVSGNMLIGLRDRWGEQGGYSARNNPANDNLSSNDAFGDILLATPGGGGWTVNIADFTDNSLSGATGGGGIHPCVNNESVFGGDCYNADGYLHEETSMGGLAVLMQNNQVAFTSMDPLQNAFSNGIDWHTASGSFVRAFEVLTGGLNSPFGKAAGLGELELVCDETPIEVGNVVWKDTDDDGIQDPDETGVNGVIITLWKDDGVGNFSQIASTTSAGGGFYGFSSKPSGSASGVAYNVTQLLPGMNYEIRIADVIGGSQQAALSGCYLGKQDQDPGVNGDLHDSDAAASGNGAVIPFSTALAGHNNHTYDVGFVAEKVAVGNYVFMDNDDNGTFNAGDMAIPAVTVWLYVSGANYGVDAPLATDVTDLNGYYYFDELTAGQYVVYIPATNFNPGQPLENKESVPGAEAGDTVDDNDNGQDTPVNGGIKSNTFTLTPNIEPSNESGSGGTGSGSPQYPGSLDDNNVNETIDFGFRLEKVAIGNFVFMDNDASGTFTAGDMAISNVVVWLYLAGANYGVDAPLMTDVTDGNGYYYFDELYAGQYVVYIPAVNFGAGKPLQNKLSVTGEDTGETVDDNDNGQDVPVNGGVSSNVITLYPNSESSNEPGAGGDGSGSPQYLGTLDDDNVNETIDFGFRLEYVAVGNYVFMDNDDNGTFNAGDMAIPAVTVWLYVSGANYGVDAPLAIDVTDAGGYYYFDNLAVGQYVAYVPAINFNAGQPLENKESIPGADAGEIVDNNDNGQDTKVNGGIKSNTFTLTPDSEPTNETGAGGSGSVLPAYPGTIDDNNVNETIDFGFRLEKVAVGNYVFMDNDDSGTFNAGDMAIQSVTVYLYEQGADYGVDVPLATDVTDAGGYYYFDNLDAGTYVTYIPASNFGPGQPLQDKESTPGADAGETVDNNDNGQDTKVNSGIRSNTFTLYPGTEPSNETGAGGDGSGNPQYTGTLNDDNVNETIDFGFRLEKVAVGNYVYMDNDDNAVYSVGDMAIPLVEVWLYPAGANYGVDVPMATDVTDPSGYYYFDQLTQGQYVVFIPALNFAPGGALEDKQSVPGADGGETVDDNDNGQDTPVGGGIKSNTFTLYPNTEPTNESGAGGSGTGTPDYNGTLDDNNVNETIDFGFRLEKVAIGNFVYMDNDDSGTFNGGDMAIPNVTVWLYPQ